MSDEPKTTDPSQRPCPECYGSGNRKDADCPTCGGSGGVLPVEVEQRERMKLENSK